MYRTCVAPSPEPASTATPSLPPAPPPPPQPPLPVLNNVVAPTPLTIITSPPHTRVSQSIGSDTPTNSFVSLGTLASHPTSVTSPQMSPPPLAVPPAQGNVLPSETHAVSQMGTEQRGSVCERPSYLDVSALSPREFDTYTRWVTRIKPAHSRRQGFLDEHAAVKFLRSELGISVDDEVNILSLFERLPLGIRHGHFYAMLRLAAWAQRGHAITRDVVFVQTEPAELRRARRRTSRTASASSVTDRDKSPLPSNRMEVAPSLEVPKAPPRQLPDHHDTVRRDVSAPVPSMADSDAGYHNVVYSPPESRLVRPMPVVARPVPNQAHALPNLPTNDDAVDSNLRTERPSLLAPNDVPMLLRPPAPMPISQQVSPLIQASLNARSEFKKASRTSRPKTFTVLSSSSGQFERDKPHLLNGEEVSPHALASDAKTRSTTATKLSSLLATQDKPSAASAAAASAAVRPMHSINANMEGQTIAPKPSYFGRERGVLPAWLREQYEEGNVLYPPPDPADPSVMSVYDALDNKAHNTMNGSERAAASINRNTPFFPPHERDRERAERTALSVNGPAEYKKLNEETSVGKRGSNDSLQERAPKLTGYRSKNALNAKSRRLEHSQSQIWGTQFEAGTYAGFKSMPSTRDLRLQLPPRVSNKRSFQIPPAQEFQPLLSPLPQETTPAAATPSVPTSDTQHTHDDEIDKPRTPRAVGTQDDMRGELHRSGSLSAPRLTRSQSLNMRQPEMHRFVLQEDATRSQLTHKHERKSSGSFYTPVARRVSQRQATTPRDEAGQDRLLRPLPAAPTTPRQEVSRETMHHQVEETVPRKTKRRNASMSKLGLMAEKETVVRTPQDEMASPRLETKREQDDPDRSTASVIEKSEPNVPGTSLETTKAESAENVGSETRDVPRADSKFGKDAEPKDDAYDNDSQPKLASDKDSKPGAADAKLETAGFTTEADAKTVTSTAAESKEPKLGSASDDAATDAA